LFKSESRPNFKNEDLALIGGNSAQRVLDGGALIVILEFRREQRHICGLLGIGFTPRSPIVLPKEVERSAPDGGDQQWHRVAAELPLMPPKPDERFLDDVVGIRGATRPLPRAKNELRAVPLKPSFPGFMVVFLHAGG